MESVLPIFVLPHANLSGRMFCSIKPDRKANIGIRILLPFIEWICFILITIVNIQELLLDMQGWALTGALLLAGNQFVLPNMSH
jgi:hypothetical protein